MTKAEVFFHQEKAIFSTATNLSAGIKSIFPPDPLLMHCHHLSKKKSDIQKITIGWSEKGIPIHAYEVGNGPFHILMYGFPDPGEAIGGTVILSLLKGLAEKNDCLISLNATWHLIPCLNFDDQPNGGKFLSRIFKEKSLREVDWCMKCPRSETKALISYADTVKPHFIYALHDEYHSGTSLPVYLGLSEVLESFWCQRIRSFLTSFGWVIDHNYAHPSMGEGFFLLDSSGAEYHHSTFHHLAQYGLVGRGT